MPLEQDLTKEESMDDSKGYLEVTEIVAEAMAKSFPQKGISTTSEEQDRGWSGVVGLVRRTTPCLVYGETRELMQIGSDARQGTVRRRSTGQRRPVYHRRDGRSWHGEFSFITTTQCDFSIAPIETSGSHIPLRSNSRRADAWGRMGSRTAVVLQVHS